MNKENQEWEFIECDTCKVKPGSPTLCAGCLNNRQAISALSKAREEERSRIKEILEKELNYRIERADNGYKNSLELMSSGSATTHWCNSKELTNLKTVLTDAINVVNSKEI